MVLCWLILHVLAFVINKFVTKSVDVSLGKVFIFNHCRSKTQLLFTLLAKKLCDSSFLDQNLDLIHSHFKTDRVMSFIF